ncbi:MAG: MarR family transcriptional regulator [Spirochaetales bacterium]|uniref:MarR family transcriptional regulator n=1 Tax=Candidatus Thalassospirochaeta sargassi TaxID=3119039 RepID=A0AAJ1MPW5_9SPIO|nr:MarR family transcriptional regulator [Spirochaetales bacterium]
MDFLPANIQVFYFFQNLSEEIKSELSKGAEGFSPTEIDILINLGSPLRMNELAKAVYCLPTNITALVVKLENDSFVERKRSTQDKRVIEVALTEKGLESRQKIIDRISAVIREKSPLNDDDYNKIMEMILNNMSR